MSRDEYNTMMAASFLIEEEEKNKKAEKDKN
jgi:hypothetical protein